MSVRFACNFDGQNRAEETQPTHLVAKLVNARVGSDTVRVILGRQAAKDDCTQGVSGRGVSLPDHETRAMSLVTGYYSRGTAIMY